MPPLLSELTREAAVRPQTRAEPSRLPIKQAGREPSAAGRPRVGATSLHISKLRGITGQVRRKLKRHGVSYTDQLLGAAGSPSRRLQLAARSGIETALLARLVCRADLLRIKGIGAILADMLELIGVDRTERLARQDPVILHRVLLELNAAERFARRAPTPEEVRHWITQARSLPPLIDDAS